eukprot:g8124.t1
MVLRKVRKRESLRSIRPIRGYLSYFTKLEDFLLKYKPARICDMDEAGFTGLFEGGESQKKVVVIVRSGDSQRAWRVQPVLRDHVSIAVCIYGDLVWPNQGNPTPGSLTKIKIKSTGSQATTYVRSRVGYGCANATGPGIRTATCRPTFRQYYYFDFHLCCDFAIFPSHIIV